MPLKEGIVELRQKGASLRLIRELLATVDVAVGTDTIARFLAEVNGEPRRAANAETPAPPTFGAVAKPNSGQTADHPGDHATFSSPAQPHSHESPAERTRTRGPRVADPRNL